MITTNMAYQAELMGRLSSEFQAVSYQLSGWENQLRGPVPQTPPGIAFHNLAGTCARLRSQTEHTLKVLEAMLYRAEELAAPKGKDS